MTAHTDKLYDCIIIGGGAAGLAAATVLARARRTVLVVDANQQSNAASRVAHNIFGRASEQPAALYAEARKQLSTYSTTSITHDTVVHVEQKSDRNWMISTASEATYHSRSVLLAQGVEYDLPDISGLREIWGTKAWHCPYCDGYEHREQKLLIASSIGGVNHMSIILPSWSRRLVYACDEASLSAEVRERILRSGGQLATPLAGIEDLPHGVRVHFADGSVDTFDAIVVGPTIRPRDQLADTLGCKRDDENCVDRDTLGRTSQPGIYVAGDQTDIMQQINIAVASGHKAGVAVHEDLALLDIESAQQ